MKITFYLIPFLLFSASSQAQDNPLFLSISLIGGSENDDFYEDGARSFAKTMKPFSDDTMIFFGGPERGQNCISKQENTFQFNGQLINLAETRQNFMRGNSCENIDTMLYQMFSATPKKKICSTEPLSIPDTVTIPAVKESMSIIKAVLNSEELLEGSTIYLNISDHGSREGENDWSISLSDGTKVMASSIVDLVKDAALKGLNIHISTDACYSGGFSKKLSELQDEMIESGGSYGSFCSTSSQEPYSLGYGTDPLLDAGYSENYFPALNKYNNQLSAAACAAGRDMINQPTNSLLEYVRGFNQASEINNLAAKVNPTCGVGFLSNSIDQEVEALSKSIENTLLESQKLALMSDVEKYWIKPLKECWQEKQAEMKFTEKLVACMETNTTFPKNAIDMAIGAFKNNEGTRTDFKDVLLMTRFLKNPNLTFKELRRFKADFCCLGRNLKTGSRPGSC